MTVDNNRCHKQTDSCRPRRCPTAVCDSRTSFWRNPADVSSCDRDIPTGIGEEAPISLVSCDLVLLTVAELFVPVFGDVDGGFALLLRVVGDAFNHHEATVRRDVVVPGEAG